MRPIGLNLLTLGSPPVNENDMLTVLRRLRPQASVFDDFAAYKRIRDDSDPPVRFPILRVINRDDAEWYRKVEPFEWIKSMAGIFDDGAVNVQLLNEPAGYEDLRPLAHWIAEVVKLVPDHVTLVCANFAVGNPDEARVLTGGFDEALKAIAGTRHYLGVHEYFVLHALDERYHHISRFRMFDQRTDALGIPRVNMVLTEFGRDVAGGRGSAGDGWKNSGLSAEQYAAEIKAAVRDVYSKRRPAIPVCIFSYGAGFDIGDDKGHDWESFDIKGNEAILARLEAMNTDLNVVTPTGTLPPLVDTSGWQQRQIKTGAAGANLRDRPTTASVILTTLLGGKTIDVRYNPAADVADGSHTWRQYSVNGEVGHIRSDAAELVPLPVAPPPVVVEPPNANITFTAAELSAMQNSLQVVYERNKAFIAHAEAAIAELKAVNDEIANVRLVLADATGRAKATTKAEAA